MAKKHFGKLLTLAAIVGAAAAGVSYVLQYKSFHKELDEDFHDFEDDFDDFDDAGDKEASKTSDAARGRGADLRRHRRRSAGSSGRGRHQALRRRQR